MLSSLESTTGIRDIVKRKTLHIASSKKEHSIAPEVKVWFRLVDAGKCRGHATRHAGNRDSYRSLPRRGRALLEEIHVRCLAEEIKGHFNSNYL